jgi:hypothetical protein
MLHWKREQLADLKDHKRTSKTPFRLNRSVRPLCAYPQQVLQHEATPASLFHSITSSHSAYLDSAAGGFNLRGELAEWNSADLSSHRARS